MFEIIFLIAIAGYFIQSFLFAIGAGKKYAKLSQDELPTASVIVAARNEEQNILNCLTSLNELIYPEGKLEIIIVDDRSTDDTGRIIDEFIQDKKRFKKIVTQNEIAGLKGKTNALANAIKAAEGEIILTTDADCCVASTWAFTMASYFTKEVAMVNGFTDQRAVNNFEGMQSLDFIYLLTVAAGTTNFDKPLSCIGNNMAYRKSAYLEVGGYENLPFSVTEDFNLLFAIHQLHKYKIIAPLDRDALVTSEPCKSIKELSRQKKRWGVGGLKSPLRGYLVMGNGFLAHLCIILSPFFFSLQAGYLIFTKLLLDVLFIYPVLKKLGIKKNIKYFAAFEIYFIIYVIALPVSLALGKKVIWKGREY
jgi:cellulose synthase/poly-beta-1,6-N-acetylglucosamine synthase-like glycosyltransferase